MIDRKRQQQQAIQIGTIRTTRCVKLEVNKDSNNVIDKNLSSSSITHAATVATVNNNNRKIPAGTH